MQRKRVKFTSGVKVGGVVQLKGSGSMRKLRCPHCRSLAQPSPAQGKSAVKCRVCGASFKSSAMG